jgi:hypothetical protein
MSEPVTDDSICPMESNEGLPCQKRRQQLSDGVWLHAGGHAFMSDDVAACMAAQHYDPVNVLSLTPLVHLDVPCPRAHTTEHEEH